MSYEAKNSYWSRASKIKVLAYSTFMYHEQELKRALSLFSLVNQMLELFGRIRIGRFTSRWHTHTDFFVMIRGML